MGGNRGDIEQQTWQILAQKHICDKVKRIISENYRKAATCSDFCSVDFKQQMCLFVRNIWCKTFPFDLKRSVKSQESGLHNLIEVKAIAKKQQVVWEPKGLSGKLGLVYFRANYKLFVQLGFHQISHTWTKWVERHETSLSDGAFRLLAFRCARILSPNRGIRAKGINLVSFMPACLELTL